MGTEALCRRADQILAIPTVVRRLPPPMKKVIENLPNAKKRFWDWSCDSLQHAVQMPHRTCMVEWRRAKGHTPRSRL
jgi:hypothetical protein